MLFWKIWKTKIQIRLKKRKIQLKELENKLALLEVKPTNKVPDNNKQKQTWKFQKEENLKSLEKRKRNLEKIEEKIKPKKLIKEKNKILGDTNG